MFISGFISYTVELNSKLYRCGVLNWVNIVKKKKKDSENLGYPELSHAKVVSHTHNGESDSSESHSLSSFSNSLIVTHLFMFVNDICLTVSLMVQSITKKTRGNRTKQ